jgi:RNA-directed DNA polymerase
VSVSAASGTIAHAGWDSLEQSAAILQALAEAILAGEHSAVAIVERCTATLGRSWPWLQDLVTSYTAAFDRRLRPRRREVLRFLRDDEELRGALERHASELSIAHRWRDPVQLVSDKWDVPRIETTGDLADWLALTPTELDWFADLKGLATHGKLQHYNYRVLTKTDGAVRVIESPKPRLKWIQQRMLSGILNRIPPHACAHGFVRGRSVKTFATPHVGRRVILRMDLRDFFPSIGGARVQTVFRTLGYPQTVADLLGGLATNATPRAVSADLLYRRPHLPQGAPTSPALANMCFYRADCRIAGLADSAGAQYTRYADDLAFSGERDFDRRVERFSLHVAAILHEEGFAVHHRKTRIMRQGVRQHLAGVVANRRLNIPRADYDRLKATLTNCARHGAAGQNRDSLTDFRAHLEGRVSYVESLHSEKGANLRELFRRIVWE